MPVTFIASLLLPGAGFVELVERVGLEVQLKRAEQLLQLLGRGRAGDWGGDARPLDDPGQRYLGGGRAARLRHRIHHVEDAPAALVEVLPLDAAGPDGLRQLVAAAVLAGEEPGAERGVGDHA